MKANQEKKNQSNSNQDWNAWQNNMANWANMNDWSKTMSNMLDFNKARECAAHNIELATNAMQLMVQSSQAIAKRAAETMQNNAQEASKMMAEMSQCRNAHEAQSKQGECVSRMVHNNSDTAKESTQIASRAADEMVNMMNKGASECIEAWANCCKKAG
jgi:hypothetical protein